MRRGHSSLRGERTKLIVQPLADALKKHGVTDEKTAGEHAAKIADKLAKLDGKSGKNGELPHVGTLMFLAPSEIDTIAQQVAEMLKANPKSKDYENEGLREETRQVLQGGRLTGRRRHRALRAHGRQPTIACLRGRPSWLFMGCANSAGLGMNDQRPVVLNLMMLMEVTCARRHCPARLASLRRFASLSRSKLRPFNARVCRDCKCEKEHAGHPNKT